MVAAEQDDIGTEAVEFLGDRGADETACAGYHGGFIFVVGVVHNQGWSQSWALS